MRHDRSIPTTDKMNAYLASARAARLEARNDAFRRLAAVVGGAIRRAINACFPRRRIAGGGGGA